MITTEILIFIVAVLFGIFLYWRESKNNYLFRLVNKFTHAKELQMKSGDKKGFLYLQPFLMRLVYLVVLILIIYGISEFLTPFRILNVKYFATIVVGSMAGTYFASMVVFASDKIEGGQDLIDNSIEKGKKILKDLTDEPKENIESKEKKNEIKDTKKEEKPDKEHEASEEKPKESPKKPSKKSGRERLKDKGLL
jgi:uncharacterized membrane protein required for colicin V production